jgi:nucleotide-binding universal stress UspA family protein
MGTHGRGGLERFFLGSVANRVIRTAPCAVVTQRSAKEEEAQ